MSGLSDKISQIRTSFDDAIKSVKTLQELDKLRLEYAGKSGQVTLLMQDFQALPVEEKKIFGPLINQLKQDVQTALDNTKNAIINQVSQAAINKQQNFDLTAYAPRAHEGHLHPYTQFIEEIENIFISMGYEVLDGPELETDFYNFTALNIPPDHPARDMYDTFWTNKINHLMRTHTSTVQIHAMETKQLPIAAIVPGRTYRHESVDASHDIIFMQCEGIYIDTNVNLSHLFATAQTFFKTLFKKDDLDIRIRPGFFPFVEPGFEIDVRCPFCKDGCSTCKKSTWIEIFPGGLIHPNVLRAGGIDPEKYSGFAFGFGLSRLAMLKYNIHDVRLLLNGKIKFLEQF
ncbi:MAG: phenylalanine--tRNA ligase subunit alpha [bacterium]